MNEKPQDVLNFIFETGDSTCPYWVETVLLEAGSYSEAMFQEAREKVRELLCEDIEYDEVVEALMDNMGVKWGWYHSGHVVNAIQFLNL